MRLSQPASCLSWLCLSWGRLPTCLRLATVPIGLMILAGCSSSATRADMGLVEGKISFQNKPLPGGTIHFFQAQEKVGSFMIRGDGAYSAEIPLGPAKVAIETLSVKYQGREAILQVMKESGFDVDPEHRQPNSPGFSGAKMTYVEIPEHYSDPEISGLRHKVVPGQQTCDFDLK